MNQNTRGLGIELFSVTNLFNIEAGIQIEKVGNRTGLARIIGKQLLINPIGNEDFKADFNNFYLKYSFKYTFELPFDIVVELKSGRKRTLNTEIVYNQFINGKDEEVKVYSYLTCIQRLRVKRKRSQLWIQKAENIMWIVNVLVAILAIWATIKSIK